jgi:hypothetical protein
VVSEEDFGERAIAEAVTFLVREKDELVRLTHESSRPFTLDLATVCDVEKFPFFSRRFPVQLVAAAALAGGQLEISCYPPSIEDVEDGPASNAERSFLLDALRKKYADHDTTHFGIADFLGAFGAVEEADQGRVDVPDLVGTCGADADRGFLGMDAKARPAPSAFAHEPVPGGRGLHDRADALREDRELPGRDMAQAV